jgi:hypothetical protein
MPLIIDDTNWKTQLGDGRAVVVGGEKFLLSGMPKPPGHDSRSYSKLFGAEIPKIPRSEWPARIKEQSARKSRISDHQRWPCDNQGSFPTCWSAGTCQTYSTARVMQLGMEHYVRISAMSLAVPISGGRRGGYEGDAVEYLTRHGGVDAKLWGYTDPGNHDSDPQVQANRILHKALETYECEGFDEFATALLLNFPCTVSYNWWSHVVMLTDLVEIEPGSFGFRIRNNWGEGYGDKGEYGFGGYAIFREGRGTPSGGFAFRQVTPSLETAT